MSARPIKVANVRDLPLPREWEPWMVWVGRAVPRWGLKASPLANPWKVGKPSHIGGGVHIGARGKPVRVPSGNLTPEDAVRLYRESMDVALWSKEEAPLAELDRLRAKLKEHGKLVLVGGPHAEVIKEVLEAQA